MSELTEKHCKPCEGGVAPYSREQAQRLMKHLAGDWVLSKEGPYLRREFKFKDFYRTMSFVNALALSPTSRIIIRTSRGDTTTAVCSSRRMPSRDCARTTSYARRRSTSYRLAESRTLARGRVPRYFG